MKGERFAIVWLAIVLLFMLTGLMWLVVNAPWAVVYLAVIVITLISALLTIWAIMTVAHKF